MKPKLKSYTDFQFGSSTDCRHVQQTCWHVEGVFWPLQSPQYFSFCIQQEGPLQQCRLPKHQDLEPLWSDPVGQIPVALFVIAC